MWNMGDAPHMQTLESPFLEFFHASSGAENALGSGVEEVARLIESGLPCTTQQCPTTMWLRIRKWNSLRRGCRHGGQFPPPTPAAAQSGTIWMCANFENEFILATGNVDALDYRSPNSQSSLLRMPALGFHVWICSK